MIFDCGETWQQKKSRLGAWHNYFAWLPRTVKIQDGRRYCAWLETIQRRGEYNSLGYFWWEYRPLAAQFDAGGDAK